MPRKCKNPLKNVTATIAYYMELRGLTNKEMCQKTSMTVPTWVNRKRNPETFNLGELAVIAKILHIDMIVLIGGLVPKEEVSGGKLTLGDNKFEEDK